MKQKHSEAEDGRRWRFIVVAAAVGALTLVCGLWLGASSSMTPAMGEAEAILVSQPAADAVADGAAFEFSYATPPVNRK